MKNTEIDHDVLIYSVGAFLKPIKVTDSEGQEQWFWCVAEFAEDSFLDGEIYNPKEFAKSKEELLSEIQQTYQS